MPEILIESFRLSPQQRHLCALPHPEGAFPYRTYVTTLLRGPLDLSRLHSALRHLVERYEILRTDFPRLAGFALPAQVIKQGVPLLLEVYDCYSLSSQEQEEALERMREEFQSRPLNLAEGPAWRVMLIRCAPERHWLWWDMAALNADIQTCHVLLQELSLKYSGRSMEEEDEPLQYADLAEWLYEVLKSGETSPGNEYWLSSVRALESAAPLPYEHPAEPPAPFAPHALTLEILPGMLAQLQDLGQRLKVSESSLLLACWGTLLARLTNQATILIGTGYDGRGYDEVAKAVGLFAKSLPLSYQFVENARYREVVHQVEETMRKGDEWQECFSWQIAGEHGEGEEPFCPFGFSYETLPASWQTEEIEWQVEEQGMYRDRFNVHLVCVKASESMQVTLHYDQNIFTRQDMHRLLMQWQTVCEQVLANPNVTLGSLQLLTEQERHLLVSEWNTTQANYFVKQGIHQLFEAQVRRSPHAPALRYGELLLSYEQLELQANQLAHLLRAAGLEPGGNVALCLPRNHWAIISLLAVLKAGGTYVPLEMEIPSTRLHALLQQISPALVISSQELQDRLPSLAVPVLLVETLAQLSAEQAVSAPKVEFMPDGLAYVMFTSGSTGVPKGVMIRQQSVSNYTQALCKCLEVQAGWHFATVSSLAADLGNTAIFCGLASGGCVHILPYELVTDAAALLAYVQKYPIDVLKIVPSHLQALLSTGATGVLPQKRLVLGGEALPWSLVQQIQQVQPTCQIYNHYGPTEATVGALVNPLEQVEQVQAPQRRQHSVPIGRPIANTQVYLLDTHLQPVPIGTTGELYIGGAGVARGYLSNPDITAEHFVPNPFSQTGGDRLYRTGDMAHYHADGVLEFLGRQDAQIKLRGYRIEPGEIEDQLRRLPGVREAVAQLWTEEGKEGSLVGYIVPSQQPGPNLEQLKQALQERLPHYMVPAKILQLEQLPLTTNGKVDRQRLPAPQSIEQKATRNSEQIYTPIEEVMLGVWQQVLEVKEIGRDEDFFRMGGHSLLGTRLTARLQTIFGVAVPITWLFEAPTVAKLSKRIAEALRLEQGTRLPPLLTMTRPQKLPLSFAQQRLWFLDQLEPGSSTYNIPQAVRLRGHLHREALSQALHALIHRHENLRTSFPLQDEQPVQQIHPEPLTTLLVFDLSHLDPQEREYEARRLAQQEAEQPFDLAHGPLLRCSLLQLIRQEEQVLLLTMHHIISDGWSMSILQRDLISLYTAFTQGQAPSLPALPIQYADFALWQRSWLQGEILERQLNYWKKHLSRIAPLELPTDHPRPAIQTFNGAELPFTLPPSLTASLQTLSQQEGVTLFMTLLAAFQILLFHYTGQEDLAIGTPVSSRSHSELEGLIGLFVNTLVLRTNLSPTASFRDLLKRVRETCLEAYTHRDLPFEQMVDALEPHRDLSRSPLFQVMFHLQHATDLPSSRELAEVRLSRVPLSTQTAKFDLTLDLTVTEQGIEGRLEYATDLFEVQTMQRLLGHWHTLLESVVAQPDASLTTIPLLSGAEYQQCLEEWNATQSSSPAEQCVQQLIEAQVERTPDQVAAIFENEHLSYRELNRRANQLAHYLQARGVGPEVRVGLALEPSLEMLLALLAVLKAGGCYVPIDLDAPPERAAFALRDAAISLLLVQHPHAPRWAQIGQQIQVVALDLLESVLDGQCTDNPVSGVGSEDLAYLLYTSGSTGVPKGVMIPHRGLVNYLHWARQFYAVAEGSGAPVHSSLSFDLTVTSLFLPLLSGRATILLPWEPGVEALTAALHRYNQLSLVKITPAHLALLSQQPDLGRSVSGVRRFVLGGEQLLGEHLAPWQELAPQAVWINEYGPTETVVGCCVYQVPAGQRTAGPIPIGRPIANTQLYLLNRWGQPVPIGVPGELFIGGEGLARGYLNRADLTAERFVPHPFSQQEGARLYKTGDLARYRADGTLEFLGRTDQQVKVRGFRIELGELETVIGTHPEIRVCAVVVQETMPGINRLVAYVVPRQAGVTLSNIQLREYVQQHLPDYMTPAVFMHLEQLPLTVNGKLDRAALPIPGEIKHEEGATLVAPRTRVEQILARIWADVLGIDQVGVTDNFFLLGGDSLLSMQIIARAAQAHLRLTPRQIFQHQTVEALAAVVNTYSPFQAEQGLVEGAVPLTPIQHWFFAQQLKALSHWNQSALLQFAEQIDPDALETAIGMLFVHHDALRMRFTQVNEIWQQHNAGDVETQNYFSRVDLTGKSYAEQKSIIRSMQELIQKDLDLEQGPLLRVAFFDRGPRHPGLLLICIHHLVVDNVSWQILLDDLQVAYQAIVKKEQPQFPPKTTSYQRWARQLEQYAQSEELIQERSFWLEENYGAISPLPLDFPASSVSNLMASVRTYSLSLSQEETRELQEHVSRTHQIPMNDIVLAMLALTCVRWMEVDAVQIDTEGHGREEIADDIDVSRTVGWFTSIYPICLQLLSSSSESDALLRLQEKLSRLPHKGFGYGVLRYLNTDSELHKRFSALPRADILLNYVGQIDQMISSATLFKDVFPSSELDRSPLDKRPYLFEIICGIRDGKFYIDWKYSTDAHRHSTIERLANDFMQAVRTLTRHYQQKDVRQLLVSHVSRVPLTQEQFEQILAELVVVAQDVETIDVLSPVQQGMLYETLSAPGSGIHVEQWLSTLRGDLDVEAFKRAWQWEIDRHTIFRTGFVWDKASELLQVTLKHASLPIKQHDLSILSSEEQSAYLDTYAEQDRKQGFDLAHPPLMRLTLFRLAHDTYRFVLTYHHMLMDLWCHHLVIREVFSCYQAYCNKQSLHLEPSLPYNEYIAWLKKQDVSEAERFWRRSLSGFKSPTLIGRAGELSSLSERDEAHSSELLMMPASITAALQWVARRHRVTLNTLFQGIWALLLSRYSNTDDVVFGITVAGRPPELPGVETMVGLCINTLPLRIQLRADASLWDWLVAIQNDNLDLRQYEYTPAGLIHTWSDVPGGQPLYESLLVVENFPESFFSFNTSTGNVTLSRPELKGAQTQYALTILVTIEKEELGVGCIYDQHRMSQPMVRQILEHFSRILEELANDTDQSLNALRYLIRDEQIPVVYPARGKSSQENDPPRSPVEYQLASIWKEVLGIQQVGIHVNFLELGGHSLLATQLISRIRTKFQVDVPLRKLFEYPTIAMLAEQLMVLMEQTGPGEVAPILPVSREQPLPLSLAQQRLWFLDQLVPDSSVYNITRTLRIRGPLNRLALRNSLEEIMRRHEVLRTTFPARDGKAVQIISSCVNLPWAEIDLQHHSEEIRDAQAIALVRDEAQLPMDIAQGPLLRAMLLKIDSEDYILVVTIHHIVFDVWSEGIFIHELVALYRAFLSGQPSPLPELPIQYADFAAWQRQWLQGEQLNKQVAYWQRQLHQASVLELPTDHPRQVRPGYKGAMKEFSLEKELSAALTDLSRQEGVTLFMTLLTGFMTLLLRYTGQTDIAVGTDIANRTRTETEALIGFFVNLLVLRGDLSRNPGFKQVLQQISKMVLEAYAHQDLPFEKLIEALHLEREGSQIPLVRTLFVFQNIPWTMPDLEEITITPASVEQNITRFELAFFMWETSEGLMGTVNYSTDLFEEKTITTMITHFKTLLQSICAQPDARLDALKMYSAEVETTKRSLQLSRLKKARREEIVSSE